MFFSLNCNDQNLLWYVKHEFFMNHLTTNFTFIKRSAPVWFGIFTMYSTWIFPIFPSPIWNCYDLLDLNVYHLCDLKLLRSIWLEFEFIMIQISSILNWICKLNIGFQLPIWASYQSYFIQNWFSYLNLLLWVTLSELHRTKNFPRIFKLFHWYPNLASMHSKKFKVNPKTCFLGQII